LHIINNYQGFIRHKPNLGAQSLRPGSEHPNGSEHPGDVQASHKSPDRVLKRLKDYPSYQALLSPPLPSQSSKPGEGAGG